MRVASEQLIAANINAFHDWKTTNIAQQMNDTIALACEQHDVQHTRFEEALQPLAQIREFLSSPQHILGSSKTKHGEIAEQFDVHVPNAWALLQGQPQVATFDSVARTAPTDYIANGIDTQSKFFNSPMQTLNGVLKHFVTYEHDTMRYTIPQDQFDIIEQLRATPNPTATAQTLLQKVAEIEALTGRPFEEVVQRSVSTYDDVQTINAYETVHRHYEQLSEEQTKQLQHIDDTKTKRMHTLEQQLQPSWKEGAKVSAGAFAVSSSITATIRIYKKIKGGTPIHAFTTDDWQEIGLDVIQAGSKSGVTAASIYTLTNVTSLSAPFAGAMTSASFGIARLLTDYKKGETTFDDVLLEGQAICFEAAMTATGATIGQALIPIPILGAIIGSTSAMMVCTFAKEQLHIEDERFEHARLAYMDELQTRVDSAYADIIKRITETFNSYDSLIAAAFDEQSDTTTRAAASITLAEAVGVRNDRIMRNVQQLDDFFTK
ncbi:hypothetical protein [Caryophanon latum]|uniref:Uncharacterized protein n=1 Tax=Caryophanon latum TaxID=33977 RepID=A0A1C0YV49_9BACL|nr:hypothetical protein [Caryophanon latum]OCS91033.1 hypothetical protein A6K76_09825 [Caryophanon latum]